MSPSDAPTQKSEPRPAAQVRRRTLRLVASPDRAAQGRCFDLDRSESWVFGRGVEGPGFVDDGRLSRSHAKISLGDDGLGYRLEDLGSTNGTRLNGQAVRHASAIFPNDVIAIGDTLLVLDEEPNPDELPAAEGIEDRAISEWVGISFTAKRVRQTLATIASTEQAVLLLGPAGSGKEVAARAVHQASRRSKQSYEVVNCPTLQNSLAEADLFGIKASTATGVAERVGVFVRASGGTVFLDEVADLSPENQAKLLRTIQEGEVVPVGGTMQKVDVRVIAATNKPIEQSSFRNDLFSRLSGWKIRLPPLEERKADVLALWDHFQRLLEPGRPARPLRADAAEALLLYRWPENVREVRKEVGRVLALAGVAAVVDLSLLSASIQAARGGAPPIPERPRPSPAKSTPPGPGPQDPTLPSIEMVNPDAVDYRDPNIPHSKLELIAKVREARGNVSAVADQLGAHRTQVYRWLKRFGIDPESYR